MKLKDIYKKIIQEGIKADIRGEKEIELILKEKNKGYEKLSDKEKELFDLDSLFNPFSDTRLLWGNEESDVKSIIVGIDVEGGELLLADRLKDKGTNIDLVVSHHPEGKAFARFYDVMDLQVDAFFQEGVTISLSESLLEERKAQVERRVHAANHQRSVDTARWLNINFLCMHTPTDNLAYQYLKEIIDKEKPAALGSIMDVLLAIPEYKEAAKRNNAPMIVIGNKKSRCKRIHLEFTGGTEGPQNIYERLSSAGIDTIISMHQSEEHFKKCKDANINVIFASHIASDTLGVNRMLDCLESHEKLKIHEFSGFKRFSRNSR